VVVPTGTASPWREIPLQDTHPDLVRFLRDGHVTGSADLLAEALRADGIIRSLGPALRLAEDAILEQGYYGYVDEGDDEQLCTADGETEDGEVVDRPFPCVIAVVDLGGE
jgi:hypothetical protein